MGIVKAFLRSEDGFTAVEYAAIAGCMAMISVMIAETLAQQLQPVIDAIAPRSQRTTSPWA
ncbi:Flp family type IVb pilin [Alsobacter sp. R-9]